MHEQFNTKIQYTKLMKPHLRNSRQMFKSVQVEHTLYNVVKLDHVVDLPPTVLAVPAIAADVVNNGLWREGVVVVVVGWTFIKTVESITG